MEEVDFLKNPKKFSDLGAKIPKGVLLMGPPGTGKTLIARAVAGEAEVPFFHISGSEFVEMFVGVGAARVRDLFAKAKKSAPCIVFIDEIDAVGRQRGAGLGGSHDEREQTLNQILVEMDGFEPNLGVIVVAATNRPDVLDPALLRPGRFDRRVVLDMPDIGEREEILKIHARGKPLEPEVNLRQLAERTPGFSGADLSNLLNEAAIRAARNNQKTIFVGDTLESIEKVLLGPERKSHILLPKEREITAYHEAGHALVAHMLPHADPVHKISIISRGRAAGYTLKLPTEDKKMHSRAEFIDDLSVFLAGHLTELEIFGDVTTGASDDLKKATNLARNLVTSYGMSELGTRTFGDKEEMIFLGREIHETRDYSEKTAQDIDEEVGRIISRAREAACDIIKKERAKLDLIAKTLLEKETIEKDEFEKLMS
jgi:cell division protease FtsH